MVITSAPANTGTLQIFVLGAGPLPHRRPPFCHDGTERRIVAPDPPAQTECYSGKKGPYGQKCPVGHALLIILFLSDTYGGRVHDKPIVTRAVSLARRESVVAGPGFWRSRCPGRDPHADKKPAGRNSPWNSNGPTRPCTTAAADRACQQ